MNVLSLFDGMSCGQLALREAGIVYTKYYSSEVDKYAIQVTQSNFPDTIQLGDVTKVKAQDLPKIDLLIGGSPCQGFSFAGNGLNFNDPRSKLFFEFVRLLKECKPKYFLMENVQMKYEHELVISKHLGVNPIVINSSLVSAQNRVRLYWTNINEKSFGLFGDTLPDIPQPKDKNIYLKDILEPIVDEKYVLTENAIARVLRRDYSNARVEPKKTGCLSSRNNSGQLCIDSGTTLVNVIVHNTLPRSSKTGKGGTGPLSRGDGKTYCLNTCQVNVIEHRKVRQVNTNTESGGKQPYQQNRIYDVAGLSPALLSEMSSGTHAIFNCGTIRRLTEVECERLQTVPDNYTSSVSSTQRYKMLGNGWTVDVIAHILKYLK